VDADPVNASAATCQLDTKALSAVTTSSEDPLIGRDVIGQYRIEKKLGSGGMGTVYLAQQTTVQRPAVIKVLKIQAGQAGDKLDLAARFAIEARAASNLNHPNIVTIYNYGEMEDGTLFIAMEYIAGETLEARLARCGQLSADCAVRVATQIASALGEAHTHGVVHRDLKPANVMLVERAGETDFVKVLDFGIAKLDDGGVTSAGYVIGTPRYMSPEQLLGKALDRRSDVYSAGIVLYEMLAGKTPFSSDTPIGWVHQHVDAVPKPPSAMSKGRKIPPALERVVLRALAKAPGGRPATMEEFSQDLEAALREPPPPPWWQRAARAFALRFAAIMLALGAVAWRFTKAIGRGTYRFVRAAGSDTWRFIKAIVRAERRFSRTVESGAWRFIQAIGRGTRWFVRAMGTGVWGFIKAIGRGIRGVGRAISSGVRRFARALGAAVRNLVIVLPVRLAKWIARSARAMVATKRRRILTALGTLLALAVTFALLFPSTIDRLLTPSKLEIVKAKPNRQHSPPRPSTRSPAREKKRPDAR
jgi:tRNA A-37 threonylcarbamoyl transferase component Bud32